MFEDNELEKLRKAAQASADAIAKRIDESFGDAFSSLPDQIRKAFDDKAVKNFRTNVKNLATDFRSMEKSLEEIAAQNDIIRDQTRDLQDSIKKQVDASVNRQKSDQAVIKSLMSQSRTIQELMDAYEYGIELAEKEEAIRKQILTIYQQTNKAMDSLNEKEEEYEDLLKKQYMYNNLNLIAVHGFGTTLNKIRDEATYWTNFFGEGTAFWAIAAIGAIKLGQALAGGFNAARDAGNSAAQSVGSTWGALKSSFGGIKQGVFVSPETAAANQGALQGQLGTVAVPTGLTEQTNALTQLGVSRDQAAGLLSYMQRIYGFQAKTTESAIKQARAMALSAGVPEAKLIEEMANNMNVFAQYASRGAASFADAAKQALQLNVSMQSIEGAASGWVDDFGTALKKQAALQTVLPGLNVSKIQWASQFGTQHQFEQAVQESFRGIGIKGISDLSKMPRSIRDMIAGNMGLSLDELGKIIQGPSKEALNKTGGQNITPEKDNWLNAIANFIKALDLAKMAVLGFSAFLLGKKVLGFLGPGAGAIIKGFKGLGSNLLGDAVEAAPGAVDVGAGAAGIGAADVGTAVAAGTAGTGAMGMLGAAAIPATISAETQSQYLKQLGLSPAEILAVHAAQTVGMGNTVMQHYIMKYQANLEKTGNITKNAMPALQMPGEVGTYLPGQQYMGSGVDSNASAATAASVEELVNLFKSGQMQLQLVGGGKKMGDVILKAHSR